jgi:dephospho-CoA kinase
VSRWPGKYVIGLTGNIGTGKSVVRKMLEHLGAYGIDADALSHRVVAKGGPGYQAVIQTFGTWILTSEKEINRDRLGRLVFSEPEALKLLEDIIHPYVEQAVDILIRRSTQPVIVIEAIKIIESRLGKSCDNIWVTTASPEVQVSRLVERRGMREIEARQRVASQSSQELKAAAANVVIQNNSTFTETWRQVNTKWQKIVPKSAVGADLPVTTKLTTGEMRVLRGKPRDSVNIAEFLNRVKKLSPRLTADDIMEAFGEKAFLLLQVDQHLVGLVGLQVENLVARVLDVVLDPQILPVRALPQMISEMERASKELQCEASLVYAPPELANMEMVWKILGYEQRLPSSLGVQAWQEAAEESKPKTPSTLYFKQLRQDRILRPI